MKKFKLIKGNPDYRAVEILADTFWLLSKTGNEVVRMDFGSIPSEENLNVCGTVACHGGWFATQCRLSADRDEDYWDGGRSYGEVFGVRKIGNTIPSTSIRNVGLPQFRVVGKRIRG